MNYRPEAILDKFNNSKITRFTKQQAFDLGRTSQHPANQQAIANIAYANRGGNGGPASNDGWVFRGGLALQITFKDNWKKFFDYCGLPENTDPQSLEKNFRVYFLSIKFYFEVNNMSPLCQKFDAQSCLNVSRKINVGTTKTTFKPYGWKEREVFTQRLASAVGLL
jgi:predicted chitinase